MSDKKFLKAEDVPLTEFLAIQAPEQDPSPDIASTPSLEVDVQQKYKPMVRHKGYVALLTILGILTMFVLFAVFVWMMRK